MKSILSVEAWQLLNFFEVEPQKLDDSPWPYNCYLYEVKQNDLSLSCSISPAYKDVQIILKNKNKKIFELNYKKIKDIRYLNENEKECLIFCVSPKESTILKIKPDISLFLENENFDNY